MTALITASDVCSVALEDTNFLTTKIKTAHIEVAQESFLRPVLGEDLYDDMTGGSPSQDYSTFIASYIKKPLAFYVAYVAFPDLTIQLTSAGAFIPGSGSAAQATDKQRELLRKQLLDNANAYMDVAVRHIEDNESSFPLYASGDNVKNNISILGGIIFNRR